MRLESIGDQLLENDGRFAPGAMEASPSLAEVQRLEAFGFMAGDALLSDCGGVPDADAHARRAKRACVLHAFGAYGH